MRVTARCTVYPGYIVVINEIEFLVQFNILICRDNQSRRSFLDIFSGLHRHEACGLIAWAAGDFPVCPAGIDDGVTGAGADSYS